MTDKKDDEKQPEAPSEGQDSNTKDKDSEDPINKIEGEFDKSEDKDKGQDKDKGEDKPDSEAENSDGDGESKDGDEPKAEDKTEETEAEDKAEEPKAEDSKAEDSKAEDSKAEEPESEAKESEEPESEAKESEAKESEAKESEAKESAAKESEAKESAAKVEVEDEKADDQSSAGDSSDAGPAVIEAKKLCKYYGQFAAIEDVSFEIPKGQVVAFLGPNGAGKSTTMKILTGFLSPSSGSAKIAGINVHEDRIEAAKNIGYMPENGPLYVDMTPRELLEFIGEARGYTGGELKDRVKRVIEQCFLEEVREKPISKLSKGFRQRVGMAQAFLHDPQVLILDEPTSGLDPNQIREVRRNIRELGSRKTILLSTHILQEVEAMADRIIFISNGRIVFDGSKHELSSQGSLDERFYELTAAASHANDRG